MRHREPIVIPDVEGDERIPIRTQNPIGAIGNYWATAHTATPEKIRLLQALADTTSVALENVQVYTELEQRVRDRTSELKATNQELEAFAYTLSHDLRTPLMVLCGFSGLLQHKYAPQLDNQGKKYIDRIQQSVENINQQIEGMLSLHNSKHSEIQCQVVDFSGMAREILANLQFHEPLRSVEVAISDGMTAQGEPALLRVILENLLSNAWKYSAKTPHARIEFGKMENPEQFYIKDNGAGFDMSQADKLFEPFERLHTSAEFAGNGIGLASVAPIVQRHSGKIWAESAPNQDATFCFTLLISCPVVAQNAVPI